MDYTLEDAFETLRDILTEREKEVEQLTNAITNNKPTALKGSCHSEYVRRKQRKLCNIMLKQVSKEEPKDYPIPGTSDLHVEILVELEEEIKVVQQLFDTMKAQLSHLKDDIYHLEKKKVGLEKMKEACLNASEMTANTSYNQEYVVTKRMFRSVKEDLHVVVEKLFPENQGFKNLLGDLTKAYTKGGDELYVQISSDDLEFVRFLIEAGIVMYHRNDRSKIRLMDML